MIYNALFFIFNFRNNDLFLVINYKFDDDRKTLLNIIIRVANVKLFSD